MQYFLKSIQAVGSNVREARTMRNMKIMGPASIMLFWTIALVQFAHADEDEFVWEKAVEKGTYIEIKGVNGSIEAEAADGNKIRVVALKHGRRSDPRDVEIHVVEHEGGITICAVYPGRGRGGHDDDCDHMVPMRGWSRRNNDVVVDFEIEVPAGVRLIARTINGKIEVDDLESDVEVVTVNGNIEISTTGHAEAKTVNGKIKASFESGDWEGEIEFRTVNGSITVQLPDDIDCAIDAHVLSGRITSDFPLEIRRGRFVGSSARGTIGKGGRSLSLRTINGRIKIEKD